MNAMIPMRMMFAISLVSAEFLFLPLPLSAAGGPTRDLDRIIVAPSSLTASEWESTRPIELIGADDMAAFGYSSAQDALGPLGLVDIRRRGPHGVQSDLSIRGTTFEESQVLVDGVKVNDPQTGHHTFDIPLTRFDIAEVAIVKGASSSVFGANAIGGALAFATRRPEGTGVMIDGFAGSWDTVSSAASVSAVSGPFANRLSFQADRSSGYRPETEYASFTVSEGVYYDTAAGPVDFFFGYLKKDFGAADFYSNLFPNEAEHTDTRLFRVSGDLESGGLKVLPKAFLRRHRDKFILDLNRPGWQTNYHTTYTYGGGVDFKVSSGFADAMWGVEVTRDTIDSTNTETHKRTGRAVYASFSPRLGERLSADFAYRSDFFDDKIAEWSPSAAAAYRVTDVLRVRASAGRAFRIPTFTDLYYRDAGNRGDPNLHPESSWTYECGADYDGTVFSAHATVFIREMENGIDWIRYSSRDAWQAKNAGSFETRGLECRFETDGKRIGFDPSLSRLWVGYAALDTYYKHDYLSKYSLDYLKHHISGGLEYKLPFALTSAWTVAYKKRIGDSGYIVADTCLTRRFIETDKIVYELFFAIDNITDTRYSEQGTVAMPGRGYRGGGRVSF